MTPLSESECAKGLLGQSGSAPSGSASLPETRKSGDLPRGTFTTTEAMAATGHHCLTCTATWLGTLVHEGTLVVRKDDGGTLRWEALR